MNEKVVYWLLLSFVFAFCLVCWRLRMKSTTERALKQTRGLLYLKELRNILDQVQQHRGLSSAFINGGAQVKSAIDETQKKLVQMMHAVAHVGGNAEKSERWQNIREHWARLSKNYRELGLSDNIRQHGALVQSLLYLIDETAQQHDLLLLETLDGKPLLHAWRELLIAAECTGQARALGSALAAKGSCDTVSRIRMKYLEQKIRETSEKVWKQLTPSAQQRESLAELLNCLRQNFIDDDPNLGVEEYFAIASRAINGLYQQYDLILSSVPTVSVSKFEMKPNAKAQIARV
jgi:hypothetical protein